MSAGAEVGARRGVAPWWLVGGAVLLAGVAAWVGPSAYQMMMVQSLRRIGPGATSSLPYARGELKSSLPMIRGAAARALGQIGPEAAPAVPDLLEHLRSDVPEVASEAAWSLGAIGSAGPEVVDGLAAALKDPNGEVRRYAAYALSQLGPAAEPAIPELVAALPDAHMGSTAARALGAIGPAARGTIPQIVPMLSSPNWWERAEAVEALSHFGPLPEDAIAALRKLEKDPEMPVQTAARILLREQEAPPEP